MKKDHRRMAGPGGGCHHGESTDILAATTKSLIEIGAATALNCHARMRRLIPAALNNGILAEEVTAALAVAGEVRKRAGDSTDTLGAALITGNENPTNRPALAAGCCRRSNASRSTMKPGPGPRTSK